LVQTIITLNSGYALHIRVACISGLRDSTPNNLGHPRQVVVTTSLKTSTVMKRTIVVVGSGPLIGTAVASHFASQQFSDVALLSRNNERLQTDAKNVRLAAEAAGYKVNVLTYPVDVSITSELESTLLKIVQDLGPPEVVVYNASRVGGGRFFEADEKSVDDDFRVSLCLH
jgi:NAD(P)-dependent dehydrogenase (short-subunit alcohol dehydrogenase family)